MDYDELIVFGSIKRAIGYFKASNTDGRDDFGGAISLSADGNTMAIGAPKEGSAATGLNGNQDNNSAVESGNDQSGAIFESFQ